jgi:ketosteroid isomerase-like protein
MGNDLIRKVRAREAGRGGEIPALARKKTDGQWRLHRDIWNTKGA